MVDLAFLVEAKGYVRFDAEDARALAELRPLLEAHAASMTDVFYARILEHPRANRAITGGPAQVERLKQTLRRWLVELGGGVYDREYLDRRAAIGERHLAIDLPQVFMVMGIEVVQEELQALARRELAGDPARCDRATSALSKILSLDLAIMLETYHEECLKQERRALIGELAAKVKVELKDRLGTIRSSAFLLERSLEHPPETATRHLRQIQTSAERAGVTIAALLNLARELEPHFVPTDINAIVRQAVAALPAVENVRIDLELANQLPLTSGDPELLLALVTSLVQNAQEAHEGRSGRVVIRTAARGASSVTLRVLDEGTGIPKDAARNMFKRFYSTKPDRAGLGLIVAKEIVRSHAGRIEAKSRTDREGAEFVVDINVDSEGPA